MSKQSGGDRSNWKPRSNPWLIAVVVTLGAFMEVLDTTIVNVSLPHISGSLGVSYDEATWSLTSYLVANGIVLTISGWLGKVFGRKRYFLVCIGAFTLCSFLCGIATSLPEIVIFRLLQGFFGGGLQPTQQAIVLDTFPAEQRGRAFGVVAIATVIAPIVGPTLGGWLTDTYSWRWVFLINIPVGVFTFFAVTHVVEDPPWEKAKGFINIDYVGLALITLGLGCVQGDDGPRRGCRLVRIKLYRDDGGIGCDRHRRRHLLGFSIPTARSSTSACSRTGTSHWRRSPWPEWPASCTARPWSCRSWRSSSSDTPRPGPG